jgi:hypothetical protein
MRSCSILIGSLPVLSSRTRETLLALLHRPAASV